MVTFDECDVCGDEKNVVFRLTRMGPHAALDAAKASAKRISYLNAVTL